MAANKLLNLISLKLVSDRARWRRTKWTGRGDGNLWNLGFGWEDTSREWKGKASDLKTGIWTNRHVETYFKDCRGDGGQGWGRSKETGTWIVDRSTYNHKFQLRLHFKRSTLAYLFIQLDAVSFYMWPKVRIWKKIWQGLKVGGNGPKDGSKWKWSTRHPKHKTFKRGLNTLKTSVAYDSCLLTR